MKAARHRRDALTATGRADTQAEMPAAHVVRTRMKRMRRRLALIALILLGIGVALASGEVWVRVQGWTPPVQVVRGNCLHLEDGIPLWGCESEPDDQRRKNRGCVEAHPDRRRVLFLGSSITYGTSLRAADVVTTALEDRLNRRQPEPGYCVLNFAERAYQFDQKYAVGRREVARYRPQLILWESWSEWRTLRLIGSSAYAVSDFELRPDGFIGISSVPDAFHRTLFLHSRLYEHFALRFGTRIKESRDERQVMADFYHNRLSRVIELARSNAARLVVYRAPPLDRPFAETVKHPSAGEALLEELLRADGVPYYALARELAGHDFTELRLDPCCHFNEAGHQALVPILERIVRENIDDRAGH
jgi:hypothetical protein